MIFFFNLNFEVCLFLTNHDFCKVNPMLSYPHTVTVHLEKKKNQASWLHSIDFGLTETDWCITSLS